MSRKKLIIIGVFLLLLTTIAIVDTYALFETTGTAAKTMAIGQWNITLNDVDVSETRTITLDDFIYVNDVHTQSNYFAPGSSAYFDLVIDATGTQVSVEYDIDIDDSQIDDYPNINFSIVDVGANQTINSTMYSDTILLSALDKTKTLRINLVWNNNPNYDESDTSLIGENLSFTINANFRQYIGE